ncbi:MAG: chorismate lyase [Legionellales bacterium]|nr:chorismate lyase [Legionellales bacterium]
MTSHPDHSLLLPIPAEVPSFLIPWLTEQGAITDRLIQESGDAQLEVLIQAFRSTNAWEEQVLHLKKEEIFYREILMWSHKTRCWFARTLIPKDTYQSDLLFFGRLQHETLGALIYDEPRVKRGERFCYSIGKESIEYHGLTSAMHEFSDVLWARRSVYTFQEQGDFYLLEIFLPGLERMFN